MYPDKFCFCTGKQSNGNLAEVCIIMKECAENLLLYFFYSSIDILCLNTKGSVPFINTGSRLFHGHVRNHQTFGTSETAGNYHKLYKVSVTDRSSLGKFTWGVHKNAQNMVYNNHNNNKKTFYSIQLPQLTLEAETFFFKSSPEHLS